MSENEKSAEKLDVLFSKVYLPVFMNKLAECGVAVESEEDLQGLLKIAALTRAHTETEGPAEKTPSAIEKAASSLEALAMGNVPVIASLLQDPDIAGVFQS